MGIDFSQFQTEINITQELLDEKLGLNISQVDSGSASSHISQLRSILTKFIGIEIIRYLTKKQSDKITIQKVKAQFEILAKKNKSINYFNNKNSVDNIQISEWFILIGLISMFGGCVANMMTVEPAYNVNYNDPDYIESLRIRSGMGKTVRSGREIVNACITINKDRGMSSSQARRICN
ncbi:MAG: hypothetical protein ACRC2S_16490 [Waterburya sp.]